MFRASSRPSSGATTTAVAASGLPLERGGSSAVGRGLAARPAGRPAGRPDHDQHSPQIKPNLYIKNKLVIKAE